MSSNLLEIAIEACRRAGDIQKRRFSEPRAGVRAKTQTELVTDTDLECERAVVELLRSEFPGHNISSEEQGDDGIDSEYTWYIDPVDGTHNFVFGIPIFGVSVGLARGGELVAGVIGIPMLDEMWSAEAGHGAWLNGQRVRVSDRGDLSRSLVIYDSKFSIIGGEMYHAFRRVADASFGVRCSGCAVFNLVSVAGGRADGFVEHRTKPVDSAAGALIVREAGGKVTDFDGGDWVIGEGPFLASNGIVHERILSLLRPCADIPDAGA